MKHSYAKNGYIHIKNFFNDDEFDELKVIAKNIIKESEGLSYNIEELAKLHEVDNAKFNSYSPRGYKSNDLLNYIEDKTKTKIDHIIREIYRDDYIIEKDATLLAWYPESLIKGFTGFHQDGPEQEIPHGYPHCWLPITEERACNFELIPNTHELGNFPHSHMGHFIKVKTSIVERYIENKQSLLVEPKDLFIFNTRLMHCLTINHTNSIAWSIEFILR
ncbi:hypothetical protein [Pseudoalteromonas piscicida]|uniref:Phytanoyl-CoA dioxygenase n=1 Tax=Pseudoalteromonas piscicida TaxID=43662 RepID=A0A2A5JU22_PSEO7|nr:hypothetical protein [Pseudoalteromonas piscicida]PCK32781.1 hypothetical protein CEX98_05110 [Pseudoalteromonas piscicida]